MPEIPSHENEDFQFSIDTEQIKLIEEQNLADTEPILESETDQELPKPKPELKSKEELKKEKQEELQELLKKEKSLRDVIFDIEDRKKEKKICLAQRKMIVERNIKILPTA